MLSLIHIYPQVLGVDALHGSEVVIPVVFKTLATQQYGPVREFRRRVRLALEENNLLPGDPNRVFNKYISRLTGKVDPTAEAGQPVPPPAQPNPENPLESTQPLPESQQTPSKGI